MADTTVPNLGGQGGNDTGVTPTGGDGFSPITSQDELNKVLADRLSRERSKFADYDDLKSKAARLDEIEEANKSEAEKAAERLRAAEQRAEIAEQQALRSKIQASHGISDDDAELFLTASDAETLERQAIALASKYKPANGAPVISQLSSRPSPDTALNGDGLEAALRRKLNIR